MNLHSITPQTCIVRDTASRPGRTTAISPDGTAASRHLHYGRVILRPGDAALRIDTGERETGFVGLKGAATATVDGKAYTIDRYDALYVPRDATVTITPGSDGCDLAEISAPVSKPHPVQHVRFADVQANPGLHFNAGGPSSKRDLNVLIGKNVEAGRIMAGVTFSEQGNWTSWPPHEHAAMLEEAYLYIDMPAPAFGIQLVYTNPREPELATIVREGDVVMMPQGYHPNVAAPGGPINFLWMMAAVREDDDRQYGVVNVQPEFGNLGSGLDKGRTGEEMTPPNALAVFQHLDWSTIPVEAVAEGIRRQMVTGDRLMVCRLTIAARTVTPIHSHVHEQITLVERGSADFFVEGQKRTAKPGDVLLFPSGIQHGATMLEEEVVLIDIFSPPREDFLRAKG